MVTVTNNQSTDELEHRQFTALGQDNSNADNDAQAQADQHQADAAMRKVEAGVAVILFAVLKVVRALIAKELPEIIDEWPDAVLKQPAEAAIPLLKKHMEKVMQFLGQNPEAAVFAMSLIPLGMGYIAAAERHDKSATTVVENAAT